MKILLIGKTGQLGCDIIRNNKNHEIFTPNRDELDLGRSGEFIDILSKAKPDLVINTAAFHNVIMCEVKYDQAFRLNCVAVRDLSVACKETGSMLVTFSSDYVFDGKKGCAYTEEDRPSPLQAYGITRAAGEFAAMLSALENVVIVRTCGLYGVSGSRSKGGNFVDKRIRDAKMNNRLEISSEQIVSPTYTHDLSLAVLGLIESHDLKSGIYHLVNEGACSWYNFTKAIFELLDLKVDLKPVNRNGIDNGMRRPIYSALENKKAKNMGIILPHWKDALKRYIEQKYKNIER